MGFSRRIVFGIFIMRSDFKTYSDFWKAYLRDHASRANRWLHIFGYAMALLFLVLAADTLQSDWLLLAGVSAFVPGWVGHLIFERAVPATLFHPVWSLISDLRMISLWCAGGLRSHLQKSTPRSGPRSIGMYELPEAPVKTKKARRR